MTFHRLLLCFFLISAVAEVQSQEQKILIEGAESLNTFSDAEIGQRYFELSGDVRIELEDGESGTLHKIRADYILFNRERQTLSARGNVTYDLIRDGVAEQFVGGSLVFNTSNWSGTFFSGESSRIQKLEERSVTFYYSGRVIERHEDGSVFILDGTISSSGIEEPYYRIEADQISILRPGEWAVKDATFYLGRIPIIPLPFFFMPGDKLFLNPSFGFNTTKGYFIQTTTYLKGKPPQESDAGFSFMQYLDSDPSLYTLEREGLFLTRRPVDEKEKKNDDYVKVIGDYYTLLGALLAVEGDFERAGLWKDLSFFSGLAVSRKIVESTGFGYTALIPEDGEYRADWQESYLLGTALPFRFGAEFNGKLPLSSSFQLTAALPFYSDPSMPSLFFPRKEGMQWKRFIDPDEVLEEDEEDRDSLVPLIGIRSTRSLPLLDEERLSFKLDKFEVRSTINSVPGGESGLYPLSYYYPDTIVLPDISFTLDSTIFNTFTQSGQKEVSPDSMKEGRTPEPPSPWRPQETVREGTQPEEFRPPAALPAEKEPGRDSGIHLFRNSLGLSIQPKYTMQNAYNVVGRNAPETVSLERDYSYQRLGGSASLNYNAVFGDRFISFENRTLFSGNYQEHTVISSNVDQDFGEDSDQSASRYDISNRYSASLRPFLNHDLWKDSSVLHEVSGVLVSGRWESDPVARFNTVPISWSDDSITSHRLTASLVRKESPARQSISMALQLPPKELSIEPELQLEDQMWQLAGKQTIRFPDDTPFYEQMFWRFTLLPAEWISLEEKLSLAMDTDNSDLSESAVKISFFEEKLKTQHALAFDLNDSELDSYRSSLRIFPLYAHYLAKREYNYTLEQNGWERDEDDFRFRPYSISTGLIFEYEPDPFWKRRIGLSLSLDSGWEMNLIRYSENHFNFTLAFNLSIAEFLDLEFASVSSNNLTYRYFDAFSNGLEPVNIVMDLLDSFAFFDRTRREQSSFNLESISIKAVHSMRDWDLNFVYKGEPVLQNEENGTPFYRWQPEFSIFIQWRPIPEIKKEISYRKEEFEW